MRKLVFLLFLAITTNCFAQQDTTLVYTSRMYVKDPVRVKWRPVVKRFGELYQVTFYDRKDVIQEVISFEDRDLEVRKGPYERYFKGNLNRKGSYDKGHRHGEWINYGIVNGERRIRKIENYYYGKLHGKFIENWPNQKIQNEGSYENGRKIGSWSLFYKDGKLAGKELYDVYGKKSTTEYFDADGKPAKYEDLFSPPTYKGGMEAFYRYLASEIKYPKQSAKEGITGMVHVSFTVKKNGSIEDVKAEKSPNDELADEAVRIVERSPYWISGKNFGEAVSVKYRIPIKFSL